MADSKNFRTKSKRHWHRVQACGVRWSRTTGDGPKETDWTEHRPIGLRWLMEKNGPLYAQFGQYLSTRMDLLSADERSALRLIEPPEATPFRDVQAYVEQELGIGIEKAQWAVQPDPCQRRHDCDSYAVRLRNGEVVSISVRRKDLRRPVWEILESLHSLPLAEFFPQWPAGAAELVIRDFGVELETRLDSRKQAEAFQALALDARTNTALWVPRVYPSFCSAGILTVERSPAVTLAEFLDRKGRGARGIDGHNLRRVSVDQCARRLCSVWMWQAMRGRVIPIDVQAGDVLISEDGRIAFVSATASPPFEARRNLWKYLLAVVADDPDECCRALLPQMQGMEHTRIDEELMARFRQAAPRMARPGGEAVPETPVGARILCHMQLMCEAGQRPGAALLAFYRGLISVLEIVKNLGSGGDPLAEAVEDIWVGNIFGSIPRMDRVGELGEMASKYASAMLELPARLDHILSEAETDGPEQHESSFPAGRERSSFFVIALLLLASGLLLLRAVHLPISAVWIERFCFAICCAMGLLVLWRTEAR
jgi:predicted unusual protein kinase regulating ubiquinone biosynthesis (AarF/ABC1/UbiB family)